MFSDLHAEYAVLSNEIIALEAILFLKCFYADFVNKGNARCLTITAYKCKYRYLSLDNYIIYIHLISVKFKSCLGFFIASYHAGECSETLC